MLVLFTRWIKFEENVEEGADRWGKPHVSSLSFQSLLNLRKCIKQGLYKSVYVGAQLRSQPILRWAIAQLRILSWVAYLKMG